MDDLSEEQVAQIADKVADRLADDDSGTSTARTYGRRGVLAALGVAALGTGSASAQASGQVGTASSPVDVEGFDVTAQNSFTDPAGVTHSGELADASDVTSAGQWQEVNSGANIEPIDGETIGTGTESVDVGSVSTEQINDRALATITNADNGPVAVDDSIVINWSVSNGRNTALIIHGHVASATNISSQDTNNPSVSFIATIRDNFGSTAYTNIKILDEVDASQTWNISISSTADLDTVTLDILNESGSEQTDWAVEARPVHANPVTLDSVSIE